VLSVTRSHFDGVVAMIANQQIKLRTYSGQVQVRIVVIILHHRHRIARPIPRARPIIGGGSEAASQPRAERAEKKIQQ
jgi:hypothetical protein